MHVYYKRLIEGVTTPAVIHNSNYYLIDMSVYEDGTLDCWKRIPLDEVSVQLKRGWLVTSIPNGKAISIHGLGSFTINVSQWNHTNESYEKYLHDIVKSMNRKMTGLFSETDEQKEKWAAQRVQWTANGTPYKVKGNFGYDTINGDATKMFMQKDNAFYLVHIIGFADGIYQVDNKSNVTAQEISEMIERNILVCAPPLDVPVHIQDFATIEISKIDWAAEPSEKLKEILDFPSRTGKKPTVHECCVNQYHKYLAYPSEENRESLREAYEAVPEHERMYLGDMDNRDLDYQRILFEPDRKREV